MPVHVALLRAVNVGGTKIVMSELRALAGELGWERPRTYIASGNLLFEAVGAKAELEAVLEAGIERRFGFKVPVMVRSAFEWPAYVAANPFLDAAEAEPNRLMMMIPKRAPAPDAAAAIQAKCRDGERVAEAGGAIWIHYPSGAGTSRLSPAQIDKAIGSPATARNWRTVLKLQEMLGQ